MKVYQILKKNLKVVSRNWIYFLVLLIFPLFLITASAILLNSNDEKNLRIGIVDEAPGNLVNIENFGRSKKFSEIGDCLIDLTNFELSVCIHAREGLNGTIIDVYVDNSRRAIESATRQVLLERVFHAQSEYIETTSGLIETKLALFSTSMNEAKKELTNVEKELENQEKTLKGYKNNITLIRTNFDIIYAELKFRKEEIADLRNEISKSQENTEQNLSIIRFSLNEIRSNNDYLRSFLVTNLPSESYSTILPYLNSIDNSINEIENNLNNLENAYPTEEVVSVLDGFLALIDYLDEIKELLENIDRDLDEAITRTQEAKIKVREFNEEISYLETEIITLKSLGQHDSLTLRFNNTFDITDDLVIIAFPFVVSIIITFSSLVLSNKFILTQVNNPSYLRESMSPTKDSYFLAADYIINMIFVAVQVLVLVLIGVFWFEIPFESMPLFILVIFLASSILVLLGLSIGYMIKIESLSVLITIFFVMFLNIFSDILVPSMLSGQYIRFLINLNPFVILNGALRDILLLDKGLQEIASPLFRLIVLFFSSAAIAYISKKASRDSLIQ